MAKNSPVDTIRNGRLKVTIWQNESKKNKGEFFYTATLVKSYKVKDTDQWKETNQLTGNEISHAAALLTKAAKKVEKLELEAAEG